ncbi:glycosyltransferase family 4 protein [Oleidesulfovibrio alaskensis]|jgi:glycosyltransferase involved in cell wall biosynthesis|uniref:glycosyltransferase family 4 protein n=1 Tax=Oleidesulfovibrio alaskensis TaxID=58180 RepID=UPI000409740E|nr:glycosyltransferase family 4 protein [Oleidesulfovibrio alaskensis]
MRTIQVVNVRWFNATAWYGAFLSRLLREAGHETLFIGLDGTQSFVRAQEWGLEPVALDLNTASPLRLAALWGRMRALVRDFRPDVVNCHRGEAFVLWGMLRKAGGRFKLVRTRGDQRLPRNNIPNRWLHCHAADAVVATNSVMARHFRDVLQVPEQKIHTIYGGVDTAVFSYDESGRQRVRAGYGYGAGDFVLGLLGRFDRVKGQKELIFAVADLYHRRGLRHVRLMLAGFETATSRAEVEAWIDEAGVRDITVITGKREDVAACISAMDAGVVASLWSETIARAALEIMACGRPLVSTGVGVMPDLLPHEALCAEGDVTALADLLEKTVRDEPWRHWLQAACVQRMKTLRERDFLDTTLAMYEQA